MNTKIAIVIVLLVIFLVITLQNTEVSSFQVLIWTIEMSRIIFFFLAGLVGFISGYIVAKFTGKKNTAVVE